MKIRWTPEAEEERFAIWAYIAENNPGAAARMDVLFSAAVASLAEQPQLGRTGKIAGTRELIPHENYRLVTRSQIRRCGFWLWCMLPVYGHH